MKAENTPPSTDKGIKILKSTIPAHSNPTSPTITTLLKNKQKVSSQKALKFKTAKHTTSLSFHAKSHTLEFKERNAKHLDILSCLGSPQISGKKTTGKNLQTKMSQSGIVSFEFTKSPLSYLSKVKNRKNFPHKSTLNRLKKTNQKHMTDELEKANVDEKGPEPLGEKNLNIPFINPNWKFNKNPLIRRPKPVEVLECSETNSCKTPEIFNTSSQEMKDSPNWTESHDNEKETPFDCSSSALKGNQIKSIKPCFSQTHDNERVSSHSIPQLPGTLNKFFTSIDKTKENFIQQTLKAFEAAKTVSKNFSKIGILIEYKPPVSKLSNYFLTLTTFKLISRFFCIESLSQISGVCKILRTQEFSSVIKNRKTELILQGLSPKETFILWNDYIKFNYLESKYPFNYQKNTEKECAFIRDINNDIDRTRFLDLDDDLKKQMLTNVLVASSNSLPNIGYVQGLNSIVSILLSQGLTEQQSYWMLLYLLKKCKINDLLSEGFPKVQILNYQLEIYMRNYLPDVIDYLGEKGFNISYFTTQWFITLFTYELEFDQIITLWSLYLVKGWKMLIRISLALIFLFKKDILNTNCDDLPNYLKSFVRENIDKLETKELFKVTLSFKVTNRLLKVLEILHDHSSPSHVILTSQPNTKLDWKILPEDFTSAAADPSMIQTDVMEYLNSELIEPALNRRNDTILMETHQEGKKIQNSSHTQELFTNLDTAHNLSQCQNSENIYSEASALGATTSNLFDSRMKKLNNLAVEKLNKINLDIQETITEESDTSSNAFLQTITNFGRQIKQYLTSKETQTSCTLTSDREVFCPGTQKPSEKAYLTERLPNSLFGRTSCSRGISKLMVINQLEPGSLPAFRKSALNLLNETDKSRLSVVTHVPPPSIIGLGELYKSNSESTKNRKELNFPDLTREYMAPIKNSPRLTPKIVKMNLENICTAPFDISGTKDKRTQNQGNKGKEDQENIEATVDAPVIEFKQLNTKSRYSKANLDMDYKKIFSLIDNQLSHNQLPSKMH